MRKREKGERPCNSWKKKKRRKEERELMVIGRRNHGQKPFSPVYAINLYVMKGGEERRRMREEER